MGNNKKEITLFRLAIYSWIGSILIFSLILLFLMLMMNGNREAFLQSPTRSFLVVLLFTDITLGSLSFLTIVLSVLGGLFKKNKSTNKHPGLKFSVHSIFLTGILIFSVIIIATFYVHDTGILNSHNSSTRSANRCERTSPYQVEPEFSRALSLIIQRYQQGIQGYQIKEYYNCLNIQYGDLKQSENGPEGIFFFDPAISNPNNLAVIVDNSYRSYDDLLTATLLVHEIIHAKQFYELTVDNKPESDCYEKEVQAFLGQWLFLGFLNSEERDSIIYRSFSKNENNPALEIQKGLLTIMANASITCNKNSDCVVQQIRNEVTRMVKESPHYQEQCKTN